MLCRPALLPPTMAPSASVSRLSSARRLYSSTSFSAMLRLPCAICDSCSAPDTAASRSMKCAPYSAASRRFDMPEKRAPARRHFRARRREVLVDGHEPTELGACRSASSSASAFFAPSRKSGLHVHHALGVGQIGRHLVARRALRQQLRRQRQHALIGRRDHRRLDPARREPIEDVGPEIGDQRQRDHREHGEADHLVGRHHHLVHARGVEATLPHRRRRALDGHRAAHLLHHAQPLEEAHHDGARLVEHA